MTISRRELLCQGTQVAFLAAFAGPAAAARTAAPGIMDTRAEAFSAIDAFVAQYMSDMNAPGMIVALADRKGTLRTTTHGVGNLDRRQPVEASQLFQIGSISKSFIAIALLQLREEGKLDLERPVRDYLPWFAIESTYAPITTHHLLTHTSGLPGDAPLFLPDPAGRHRAAYPPGEHFHYSNMCYRALGLLLATLDDRTIAESLERRIFAPLGMSFTSGALTSPVRDRTVTSYLPDHDDRPYPRRGPLTVAPDLLSDSAAGSIASTAADMGRYLTLLASGGRAAPKGVLTEQSFALMTRPWIKAPHFGPDASYGYGIAVDTVDGHTVLRHTGGMISFMSAMHVDVDAGVGAFASINAQQGYRPNPVAAFSIGALRAADVSAAIPAAPAPNPPERIERAADYAGRYSGGGGHSIEFIAEGERLYLLHAGARVPLEVVSAGGLLARHPDFELFTFHFGRQEGDQGPVTEVVWGPDWFANERYSGPRDFTVPEAWAAYSGHYRSDDPWVGSVRFVCRKGQMRLVASDGEEVPMEPAGTGAFRLVDPPYSPEWVQFLDVVDGRSRHVRFSGADLRRLDIA